MNRDPVRSSAAVLIGSALAALLAVGASAAETGRSRSEPSTAALQQRLEAAQRRLENTAEEIADLNSSLSRRALADTGRSSRRAQRAVLGVDIGSDADGIRSEGVQVLSVRPGSGAYEAGLKFGDLLLAVDGKSLRRDDDGSPREKLLALMRGVRAGDKLSVKYRRDGFTKTVSLTARPLPERPASASRVARIEPTQRVEPIERAEPPRIAVLQPESVLGNAELVPLTARLGRYFGTDKGLLVVRAPANESLDIQEGDVILEIDGRTPDSTSHAIRILGSYQPGEDLTLSVLRRKRTFDIELTIPQDAARTRVEPRQERAPRKVPVAPAQEPVNLQVQPLPDEEVEVEPAD